jgi:hypothetical protein
VGQDRQVEVLRVDQRPKRANGGLAEVAGQAERKQLRLVAMGHNQGAVVVVGVIQLIMVVMVRQGLLQL